MNDTHSYSRCCRKVRDGASMVRGFARMRPCDGRPVFVDADGNVYCATHGKAHGYVKPVQQKQSYVIFYTTASGKKTFAYAYDKASERGAVQSFRRTHPEVTTVDGVAVYENNAAMQGPQFDQWRAWM